MPVEGQGGSHCRTYASSVTDARLKTTSVRFDGHGDNSKNGNTQCGQWYAACGGKDHLLSLPPSPKESQSQKTAWTLRGEGFRAHDPPQGPCEKLMVAVGLLANLQTGADNLVDTGAEQVENNG